MISLSGKSRQARLQIIVGDCLEKLKALRRVLWTCVSSAPRCALGCGRVATVRETAVTGRQCEICEHHRVTLGGRPRTLYPGTRMDRLEPWATVMELVPQDLGRDVNQWVKRAKEGE